MNGDDGADGTPGATGARGAIGAPGPPGQDGEPADEAFLFKPTLTASDLPAVVGTCANSPALLCLAGRTGTTNDPTLTTTAAGTGNIYGASTTGGGLSLHANSADLTGLVTIDAPLILSPSTRSVTADYNLESWAGVVNLSGGANFSGFLSLGTLNYNAAPTGNVGLGLNTATIAVNFNASMTITGSPIFGEFNTYTAVGAGVTLTLTDAAGGFGAFHDSPTFAVSGGAAFSAAAAYSGFKSRFVVNSGTIDTRRGFRVVNATGAGTLNNQVAFTVDDLTKGGTSNVSYQSLGAAVSMRHAGPGVFGANAAPTNASVGLEVQSTTLAFLLPRMTTTQRDAMTPVAGMMIYNTTIPAVQARVGVAWASL